MPSHTRQVAFTTYRGDWGQRLGGNKAPQCVRREVGLGRRCCRPTCRKPLHLRGSLFRLVSFSASSPSSCSETGPSPRGDSSCRCSPTPLPWQNGHSSMASGSDAPVPPQVEQVTWRVTLTFMALGSSRSSRVSRTGTVMGGMPRSPVPLNSNLNAPPRNRTKKEKGCSSYVRAKGSTPAPARKLPLCCPSPSPERSYWSTGDAAVVCAERRDVRARSSV